MRRVAVLGLLLVLATVFIADPIACADGCTDGSRASQAAPTTSCSLCQRSVALDAIALSVAPMPAIRPVHQPRPPAAVSLFVPPIDHPPRPA